MAVRWPTHIVFDFGKVRVLLVEVVINVHETHFGGVVHGRVSIMLRVTGRDQGRQPVRKADDTALTSSRTKILCGT